MANLKKIALFIMPLSLGLTMSIVSESEAGSSVSTHTGETVSVRAGDSQRKQETISLFFLENGNAKKTTVFEYERRREIRSLRKGWRPGQPRWAFVKPYRVFEDLIYIGPDAEEAAKINLFRGY
jgi:hypothetical protein